MRGSAFGDGLGIGLSRSQMPASCSVPCTIGLVAAVGDGLGLGPSLSQMPDSGSVACTIGLVAVLPNPSGTRAVTGPAPNGSHTLAKREDTVLAATHVHAVPGGGAVAQLSPFATSTNQRALSSSILFDDIELAAAASRLDAAVSKLTRQASS